MAQLEGIGLAAMPMRLGTIMAGLTKIRLVKVVKWVPHHWRKQHFVMKRGRGARNGATRAFIMKDKGGKFARFPGT